MKKTLIIHRHGEYKQNLDPVLKLNRFSVAENFLQGKELEGKKVAFYSSPIERAQNTIKIKTLASKHNISDIITVAGFHENNFIFDGMDEVYFDDDIDVINIASHLPTIADALGLETLGVDNFVKIEGNTWDEVQAILNNKKSKFEVFSPAKNRICLLKNLVSSVFGNSVEEIVSNLEKAYQKLKKKRNEMINIPSPHFNERKLPVSILVFHCSVFDAQTMIKVLDEDKLSSHYIIGFDGEIIKQVSEDKRAWHAGVSYWNKIEDLNSASIGIEISNETLGQSPYNEKQIKSIISLSKKIIKKHNIKPQNIVAHSDIAPMRKPDPGICFPWELLAKKGIGLWHDENHIKEKNPAKMLKMIGYDTRTEENIIASAYAFARRFLPELVPFESDIKHLVENVYPHNASILANESFIKTLQAVAYQYKK